MARVESAEKDHVMMSPQVLMHSSGAAADKRTGVGHGQNVEVLLCGEPSDALDSKKFLIRVTFSVLHLNRRSSSLVIKIKDFSGPFALKTPSNPPQKKKSRPNPVQVHLCGFNGTKSVPAELPGISAVFTRLDILCWRVKHKLCV